MDNALKREFMIEKACLMANFNAVGPARSFNRILAILDPVRFRRYAESTFNPQSIGLGTVLGPSQL